MPQGKNMAPSCVLERSGSGIGCQGGASGLQRDLKAASSRKKQKKAEKSSKQQQQTAAANSSSKQQ
jgi:hypothetical protein